MQYRQKVIFSIPNINKTLSIPHVEKLFACNIDKNLLFILGIDNVSTYGIDKTFSILGIYKLYIFDLEIFCLYHTWKYCLYIV